MKKRVSAISVFKNPLFIIFSIILGVFLGIQFPTYSNIANNINFFYIKLLTIFSLSVFVFSILNGAVNISKIQRFKHIILKMFLILFLFSFISGLIGAIVALIAKPGSGIIIDNEIIKNSEAIYNLNKDIVAVDLIKDLMPKDIITPIIDVNEFGLIFIFIILGLSISKLKNNDTLSETISSTLDSLQNIYNYFLILLPLGTFSLVYYLSSTIELKQVELGLSYIYFMYFTTLFITITGLIFVWLYSGQNFIKSISTLLGPIVVSITTNSSLIALPFCTNSLHKELKFNKITTNLYFPIINSIGNLGNTLYFSFSTIFVSQIFNIKLSIFEITTIIILSALIGFLSTGLKSVTVTFLVVFVIRYLGIPPVAYISLLVVLEVFIKPARSLITTILSLVCTSIVGKPKSSIEVEDELGVIMQNFPDDLELRSYFHNFKGEIPVINQKLSELLFAVFPNATFKKYKSWEDIEDVWNNYELDLVIGEREFIKNISLKNKDEYKFAVVKPRI